MTNPYASPAAESKSSKLVAYVQLFRLANVFTALADVLMGFLFTHPDLKAAIELQSRAVPLLLASALLYTAGMVLNDVFDVELDRTERPERPLPSGKITVTAARWLGFAMLIAGAALPAVFVIQAHTWRPLAVSGGLALLVLLYDAILKRTPLGPLAMGGCRFLNVLLGMSLVAGPWSAVNYQVAGSIGLYIVGVTWFARNEAKETIYRGQLLLATLVIVGGIGLLAWFPWHMDPQDLSPRFDPDNWRLFCLVLGAFITWRCVRAIFDPHWDFVREAVGACIMSIIMLDAAASFPVCGPLGPLVILPLLLPLTFLRRWSYAT